MTQAPDQDLQGIRRGIVVVVPDIGGDAGPVQHISPLADAALDLGDQLGQLGQIVGNPLVFGEDVGRKGGVYGVTRNLQQRLGPDRVIDTLTRWRAAA